MSNKMEFRDSKEAEHHHRKPDRSSQAGSSRINMNNNATGSIFLGSPLPNFEPVPDRTLPAGIDLPQLPPQPELATNRYTPVKNWHTRPI